MTASPLTSWSREHDLLKYERFLGQGWEGWRGNGQLSLNPSQRDRMKDSSKQVKTFRFRLLRFSSIAERQPVTVEE